MRVIGKLDWTNGSKDASRLDLNLNGLMANQAYDSGFDEQSKESNSQPSLSQVNGSSILNLPLSRSVNNFKTNFERTRSPNAFGLIHAPRLLTPNTNSFSSSVQWRNEIPFSRQRLYTPRTSKNIPQPRKMGFSHVQLHFQTGHQYCAGSLQPLNSSTRPDRLYRAQAAPTVRPVPPNDNSLPPPPLTVTTPYQPKLLDSKSTPNFSNKHAKEQMMLAMRQAEVIQRDLEEEEGNFGYTNTYFAYRPSKLRCGLAHPDSVIESSSLSSVPLPDIHYVSRIPEYLIDTGTISALQYEALIYACQMHERLLPSGERAGYLIGDGAGVGKGRTIASLIYENYLADRKKSIWLSVSSDLRFDALRDLRDIGATNIQVHSLNKFKYAKINSKENGRVKKGVVFATYSSLIGECKSASKSYSSRIKQLVQWFGKSYDGLIVFDECHRAKNLVPGVGGKTTKTGRMVLELQKLLPNARIVYASATGATEPRNMAYMTRLGLWGEGRSFANFGEFLGAVEKRGIGAMEIVAVEMKQRGLYLSRQLSFHGAAFRVEEIRLTDEYIKVYDNSVRLWTEVRLHFQNAIAKIPQNERSTNKFLWSQFWASHQRYFKYLCIAAKVEACVKLTRQAIAQGKCVVIGLQSTGESRTREAVEEQGGELSEFVSTAKAVLQNLIENHFPGIDEDANDVFEQDFLDFDKKKRKRKARDLGFTEEYRTWKSDSDFTSKRRKSSSPNDTASSESEDNDTTTSGGSQEYELSDESELEVDGDDEDDWIKTLYEEVASGDESETTRDDENSRPASGMPVYLNDQDYEMELSLLQSYLEEQNSSFFEEEEQEDEINPFFADFTKYDPWADRQQGVVAVIKEDKKDKKERRRKLKKKRKMYELELKEREQLEEMLKKREQALEDASKHTAKDFLNMSRVCEELDPVNPSEIKAKLLVAVETLGRSLPPNTLDHLIDELGGPEFVAEMTGRRGRLVQNEEGRVTYELRHKNSDVPLEFINMEEKEKFMMGDKKVAIISEAASSGISLQSDKRALNTLRRVHITLELPWSADKAIQQFGRTHRSNQVSAPEYLFLISELAGEKRFASIVAKRLESLGALTHGDRRATETQDFSQFNLDTKYGRQALECLLRSIIGVMKPPLIPPPTNYKPGSFFTDMSVYLESVGILSKTSIGTYTIEKDGQQMSKFLNRILGIPVHAQSALFRYFSDILAELISQAKRDGTYDMGIMDLGSGGTQVQIKDTRVFLGSPEKGSFRVEMHKIGVERGITWDEALSISKLHTAEEDGFYVLRKSSCKQQACVLVYGVEFINAVDNKRSYIITRPSTGRSPKLENFTDLSRKFVKTDIATAEKLWKEQFDASSRMCQHHYIWGRCRTEENGRFCEVGRRMRTYFVLSGSILSVWPIVESVFSSDESEKKGRQIQMIRVNTEQDQKIVGVLVLPLFVRALVNELEKFCARSFVEKKKPIKS